MRKGVAVEVGDLIILVLVLLIILIVAYDLLFQRMIGNEACHAVADMLEWEGPVISALRGLLDNDIRQFHQICDAVVRW